MNTHKVLRPFEGHIVVHGKKEPYQFEAGELVDATNWRNTDGLIRARYLAPLPVVVIAEEVATGQKRQESRKGVERSAAQSATAKRGLE